MRGRLVKLDGFNCSFMVVGLCPTKAITQHPVHEFNTIHRFAHIKDHRFALIFTPNESVKICDKIRVNLWINLLFKMDVEILRMGFK